jgi:phosphoribosylaminoimidazolecarboxamide formyltransferase/IMP cyclohydrolase
VLRKKKNLRLIRVQNQRVNTDVWEIRSVGARSFLAQTPDALAVEPDQWKVVSQRQPTELEKRAMSFGWRVVKHVKSNAIVFVAADRTLGIGAGQMSRVDSSRIAVWKANEAGLSLKGSTVCSDAFFPFPDGLLAAADAGATAVIQPGGSVRDADVITAANGRGIAMVFTGIRHFRH